MRLERIGDILATIPDGCRTAPPSNGICASSRSGQDAKLRDGIDHACLLQTRGEDCESRLGPDRAEYGGPSRIPAISCPMPAGCTIRCIEAASPLIAGADSAASGSASLSGATLVQMPGISPWRDCCHTQRVRVGADAMLYVWVALGGALGSVGRAWVGLAIARLTGPEFPWGTILINIVGSFVIGFFGTLTAGPDSRFPVLATARPFVMIGICGGFTTFSSFSLQTLELAREGRAGQALGNILLSMVLCLASVTAGHSAGAALNPGRIVP
jgi:protein CrcB